jgi:hypothetical protein
MTLSIQMEKKETESVRASAMFSKLLQEVVLFAE